MQISHPSTARSDRKGMFTEHSHQYASAEHMLTVMASKSAHSNNFHLRHSDMNPNNRRPRPAAAAAIDQTGGGGGGMEHLFPYEVHCGGNQPPGQLVPLNLFHIDHSNGKSTVRQQQQQKWIGDKLQKAHAHHPYNFARLSLMTAKGKRIIAPTPHQPKPALRNPKKAPRGCPEGHWWCKLCSKYLVLKHFNPSTKAMQYKYLCANCETKTKQDQAVKFKRGRDGNVNPKHPRRVGAQNKSVKDEGQQHIKNGLAPPNNNVKPNKKRRRRGRQWGSVEKLVNSFDPNVDWRLVVLGMRNQTVHFATNFESGKEFATQDLLIRFRHWVMLQEDGRVASRQAARSGPTSDEPPKAVARMNPDATARSAEVNLLLQRIQNLGVQQRLVSQELDDCLCALVHLQRSQGLGSQSVPVIVPRVPATATVPVSSTCPVAV